MLLKSKYVKAALITIGLLSAYLALGALVKTNDWHETFVDGMILYAVVLLNLR